MSRTLYVVWLFMAIREWPKSKKMHHAVLLISMILTVVTFNLGREILAAGIIVTAVILMALIDRKSERPVYDERDITIAEESTHQAVMISGAFLGIIMIFISAGIGLNYWSYPDRIAPYYLAWGGIVGLTIIIEVLKRYRVIE